MIPKSGCCSRRPPRGATPSTATIWARLCCARRGWAALTLFSSEKPEGSPVAMVGEAGRPAAASGHPGRRSAPADDPVQRPRLARRPASDHLHRSQRHAAVRAPVRRRRRRRLRSHRPHEPARRRARLPGQARQGGVPDRSPSRTSSSAVR
ncbi:MAG: hypothetical protein WDN45_07420 [Caulobacteraceae bacterium]